MIAWVESDDQWWGWKFYKWYRANCDRLHHIICYGWTWRDICRHTPIYTRFIYGYAQTCWNLIAQTEWQAMTSEVTRSLSILFSNSFYFIFIFKTDVICSPWISCFSFNLFQQWIYNPAVLVGSNSTKSPLNSITISIIK